MDFIDITVHAKQTIKNHINLLIPELPCWV